MRITINLLPKERKSKLKADKWAGWFLNVGISAVLAILVFAGFLYSSTWVIDIQKDSFSQDMEKARSSSYNKTIREAENSVNDYYQKAGVADKNISSQPHFWNVINDLGRLLPEGVYYSDLKISGEEVALEGFAEKRNQLVELEKALKESDKFSQVKIPISSFTSKENINFNINLKHKGE
ncbi:MAG: PilN domain-containing protein [Candidatus Moranbacteria bacterium]|nr:PilN domain-containing protein [Candidatus Moranbacteria bacterium]